MKINQYNENNKPDGYWEHYSDNGQLYFKGYYNNGNPYGYFQIFNNSKKFFLI